MTLFGRNVLVSTTLVLSDFISFIASIYLAMGLLSITLTEKEQIILFDQTQGGFVE